MSEIGIFAAFPTGFLSLCTKTGILEIVVFIGFWYHMVMVNGRLDEILRAIVEREGKL